MSSKTHSKKRNAGLLYEFLIRMISRSLVEGDKKKSSAALKILKRHFKPGTELYKEMRLINSLMKTTVSSDVVAGSIISEAKNAARGHDVVALEREKSLLIRNINHVLNDEMFYDQPINEYKMFATIQSLINDWRIKDPNIQRLAEYEDALAKWLVAEKKEEQDVILSEDTPGTSRLIMKVMMKRLNEKYAGTLSDEQRALVKAYAFSTANDDKDVLKKKLVEIKDKLTLSIDSNLESNDNEYVVEKLKEAKATLLSESFDDVNDESVTRFMLYAKLINELNTKGDENE